MANSSSIGRPWRRLIAEGVVIVLSILLAFGVDAWWDGHRERVQEDTLLSNLLAGFEASRPDLIVRLDGARRMAAGNAAFRDLVGVGDGPVLASVPDSFVLAVIGSPTYDATTNALDAAVASGQIEIIRNEAIRAELANWRRSLADTREDELLVRQITTEQVVPLLSREMDLGGYYDRLLPWFYGETAGEITGTASVRRSTELSGALAQRNFYVSFSATDLEELLALLDRLVALIEGELGGARS